MSLYIQGCIFWGRRVSQERRLAVVRAISQAPGAHVGLDLEPEDAATIRDCLDELGIFPVEEDYFLVSDNSDTGDATAIWTEAYELRLKSDMRITSSLENWFRSLLHLRHDGLGIAVAAFDGGISQARECSLEEGVDHLVASLATPWHALDNVLYVMSARPTR